MRLRCTVDRIAQFRLRKHAFGLSLTTDMHEPPKFFADGRKLSLQPLPLVDCRPSSSLLRQKVQLGLAEIGHLCTQPTRGTAGRESTCQSKQLLVGGLATIKQIQHTSRMASWRSGYAEDCKSLHPGSIPGEASTFRTST